MLYNLTDVFTSPDITTEQVMDFTQDEYECDGQSYRIVKNEPVHLVFSNIGKGKAKVNGQCAFSFAMQCDRCLKDVTTEIELNFEYEVKSPETEMTEEEKEEQSFMKGYQFDADEVINNEILMKWPMKVLCSDDCKGICPVCGNNLNDGDCGCDSFVPDPRLAKIKDIFNANKEV